MMEIVGMVIFGGVIGALARFFMKGDQNIGTLWTIILGVVGVALGNFVLSLFSYPLDTPGIDWMRWIVCTVCAVIAISVYLGIKNRK
ncbi:transglycosylase [Boudabousia marimammalium]|uniref:Transglycosylase n=1 Tax=Boudabousia marimammalium TaxID=156892 RepID=A0A1Q5PSW6_9ACTO|nr:GlsB/YeaQ/YmgE family stress response membrane protein [Boudabousia marimammalium]OKL50681.1 transglycosylase [Boudabousia marimammalium]